ncbi:MAG: diguanylate cyclase domain-containing protein [Solidesulfovibrio sp. DCME]|uniref:diguanylate cyclase domain-containing protein n=1 Tax=Solidesulfovibrio sp. DCME TaxID=3447380 RepID=UPI003D11BC87
MLGHTPREKTPPEPGARAGREPALPTNFLNYCARTGKSVTRSSVTGREIFNNDGYFVSKATKSAMALPLIHSGSLKGMLYLENDLVEEAFTPRHQQVLGLLSSQIAISIENAKFYKELEQMVAHRTAELLSVNQQLQDANAQLERLSNIDGLTGIFNRRSLDDFAEREWKRHQRQGSPFSLIMCDIDFFKRFNDAYGHIQGDQCLRRVAQALEQAVQRPGDFVARYGGEEFAIILPETDLPGLTSILEKLRAGILALAIPHAASQAGSQVSLSFGACSIRPAGGQRLEDTFFTADRALYAAKAQGRNRYVIAREIVACVLGQGEPGGRTS